MEQRQEDFFTNAENLTRLAQEVHEANKNWWINIETGNPIARNTGELLMLVISELSEALEGHRKNLMDDKLPHRKMFEVELADAIIRLLDIAGGFECKFDLLEGAVGFSYKNVPEYLLNITKEIVDLYSYGCNGTDIQYVLGSIAVLGEREGCDLVGAYNEKMKYNAQRADHKIENRKLAHGKKY